MNYMLLLLARELRLIDKSCLGLNIADSHAYEKLLKMHW